MSECEREKGSRSRRRMKSLSWDRKSAVLVRLPNLRHDRMNLLNPWVVNWAPRKWSFFLWVAWFGPTFHRIASVDPADAPTTILGPGAVHRCIIRPLAGLGARWSCGCGVWGGFFGFGWSWAIEAARGLVWDPPPTYILPPPFWTRTDGYGEARDGWIVSSYGDQVEPMLGFHV